MFVIRERLYGHPVFEEKWISEIKESLNVKVKNLKQ
jgi:hypothetical protein